MTDRFHRHAHLGDFDKKIPNKLYKRHRCLVLERSLVVRKSPLSKYVTIRCLENSLCSTTSNVYPTLFRA